MKNMIRPIRSKTDYHDALERLASIMNAEKGTKEADERDVLAILIEKYEKDHFQTAKPTPVESVKFRMEQAGLSQNDLIPYLGSRSKVSEFLAGKKNLTLKMIRALHTHLGIPAEVLLGDPADSLPTDMAGIDFDRFPISEMAKNGAFEGFDTSNMKERADELIRALIESSGGFDQLPEGLFRKTLTARANAKIDPYALQGWSLQLLSAAKKTPPKVAFKKAHVSDAYLRGLASISITKDGPCLVADYLSKAGIIFKIVRHLKRTYLDGASFITKDGVPVIGLTCRYDRLDNFWFTLFHEIGHVVKHLESGRFITDDMTLRDSASDDKIEKEADRFAEEKLLGGEIEFEAGRIPSQSEVIAMARELNIHEAIVAGNIQHKLKNFRIYSNLVGSGMVSGCLSKLKPAP